MFCCGATASRTAPLITQTVEHGHNPVLTSQYTHTFGSATLFEARAGGIYIRDNFTPVSDDFSTPGRTDQATGFSSGQRPDRQQAVPQPHHRRRVGLAQRQRLPEGLARLQVRRADRLRDPAHRQRPLQQRLLTDLNAAPYLATFQDPSASGGRIRSRRRLPAGQLVAQRSRHAEPGRPLRPDHAATSPSSRPARRSTASPATPRSTSRTASPTRRVEDLIAFNTSSPRVGITLRADQSGKTVVKANYGRFFGKLATSMFNSMSPGATPTTTLRYNTATRAYDIPFTVVDNRINFSVNPDLQNQYTDQLFVGLERELLANMGVNVSFVWKEESNFIRLQDVRGTYAQRAIVDTFEGQTFPLNVFNLTSSQASRLFQVVNREDFDQSFKSVVIELNKRFSDSWQSQGSYTWQDSQAFGGGAVTGSTQQDFSASARPTGFGRDPNDSINAFGPTATNSTHAVKLSTTYRAPLDFNFGMRYSYESGRPYGRLIIVRGLGQGNVTMLAEDARAVCPAGGERFPGPRRQGFRHHRQPAHPALAGLLQHLQHGYDADAPQQQLAGHGDDAVGADAVDCQAAHGPVRHPLPVLMHASEAETARLPALKTALSGRCRRLADRFTLALVCASLIAVRSQSRQSEWRYFGGDKAFTGIPRSIRSTATTSSSCRSSGDGRRLTTS